MSQRSPTPQEAGAATSIILQGEALLRRQEITLLPEYRLFWLIAFEPLRLRNGLHLGRAYA
jgi:hypothetical protein